MSELGTKRLEPFVELAERLHAQAVHPSLGIAANRDQAGIAKHLQVSRDTRLMHAHRIDELRYRALAALVTSEGFEDSASRRIGDDVEDAELWHHPNIR